MVKAVKVLYAPHWCNRMERIKWRLKTALQNFGISLLSVLVMQVVLCARNT